MNTECGGESSEIATLCQSRHKKGNRTNTYLTESDEEIIVDFVKDHEDLYSKTNDKFKDKACKDCLWGRFSRNLLGNVCKTWFESQRTLWKINPVHVWPGPKEMTERQRWIHDKFEFLKSHIDTYYYYY